MKIKHKIGWMRSLSSGASARLAGVLLAGLIVTATSVGVMAWGPERQTFTTQKPADYVTFNSITNNPAYGDERNFVRIKEATAPDSSYSDDTKVEPGKDYQVYVYFHNNASKTLNDEAHGKQGIANNTRLRMALPGGLKANQRTGITGYISADNAKPGTVHDNSYMTSTVDVALRYIPGSAVVSSFGAVNGQKLPDALFGANGTHLGYDSLNGVLPGCNEYAGYVTFKFRADAPNFTVKKEVRKNGEKTWQDKIVAKVGEKVDFLISYHNTGSVQQDKVIIKDALPKGTTFVAGSVKLANSANPNGTAASDAVVTNGANIGSYAPDGKAYMTLSATINKDLKCGANELVNYATVITPNGNKQDTATVSVEVECQPNECKPGIPNGDSRCSDGCVPKEGEIVDANGNCVAAPADLPKTGPAEIVLSFIGLMALVAAVVYWYRSRMDMKRILAGTHIDESTVKDADSKVDNSHHTDKPKASTKKK